MSPLGGNLNTLMAFSCFLGLEGGASRRKRFSYMYLSCADEGLWRSSAIHRIPKDAPCGNGP